jgi:hypothetical protein
MPFAGLRYGDAGAFDGLGMVIADRGVERLSGAISDSLLRFYS